MRFGFASPQNMALFTDQYELTMAQAYWQNDMNVMATFELFVRDLPPDRGYLIVAGLEQACYYLKNFKFGKDELDYLRGQGFDPDFLRFLTRLRFEGDVWAMPEGELAFYTEPLLRVTAPIIQAQLLETFLINVIHFQTLIATKAARIVWAARGRPVVDFGSRRAHGLDAGIKAARACYLAGCAGTSNVLAGQLYDIPIFGTMAHSFIEVFPTELAAFEAFVRVWGGRILLIDTYDTLEGARRAAHLAKKLKERGQALAGVRIDSGDLLKLSRRVRRILDEEGLPEVKIFASGGLDEYRIDEFLRRRAPMDAFGVGTRMVTSADRPALEVIYKLMESADETSQLTPRMKIAEEEKLTYPGAKQVFRVERGGKYQKDMLCLWEEVGEGSPRLVEIFRRGKLVYRLPTLSEIRERVREELEKLPARYKRLRAPARYPVKVSPGLKELTLRLKQTLREHTS